jgi:hypothetical protein
MMVFKRGHRGQFVKVLLIANLCLWIYFWIAFAHASHPPRPNPTGYITADGYTFWGHSIAGVVSPFLYRFFRIVFYTEFPSFLLVTLAVCVFSPYRSLDHYFGYIWYPHGLLQGFFAGISAAGWLLLATMALSFLQWYFIGWVTQKLWRRLTNRPTSAPN